LLKFESDLVCAPCRHGKMIAAFHSPVNTVMTEHPGQLLHMDTVGLLGFVPWEASGTSLSLLTTTLVTLGFSSWRVKIKYLSTFDSWL
jgi:hypothetical protein